MDSDDIDYSGYDRDQLIRFLKLRDRQANTSRQHWVRAGKEALAGDTRALRNRIDMAEAPFEMVVQSSPPSPKQGEAQ